MKRFDETISSRTDKDTWKYRFCYVKSALTIAGWSSSAMQYVFSLANIVGGRFFTVKAQLEHLKEYINWLKIEITARWREEDLFVVFFGLTSSASEEKDLLSWKNSFEKYIAVRDMFYRTWRMIYFFGYCFIHSSEMKKRTTRNKNHVPLKKMTKINTRPNERGTRQ